MTKGDKLNKKNEYYLIMLRYPIRVYTYSIKTAIYPTFLTKTWNDDDPGDRMSFVFTPLGFVASHYVLWLALTKFYNKSRLDLFGS